MATNATGNSSRLPTSPLPVVGTEAESGVRANRTTREGRPRFRVQVPLSQRFAKLKRLFPRPDFSWVTGKLDASHLKPVLRSAFSAWICVILLVATKSQETMGQSSFLILIAALLSPPVEPFIAVLEREISNMLFVALSFGYCCLAIFLSNLSRTEFNNSATTQEIFTGRYIEAWPTVICAVFLFIGTSFLLYMRARIGQGPYALGPTFGCIVVDIVLTVSHFYPYSAYQIAKACLLPFFFHSAVALGCSFLVFPETINAQFIKRFRAVFIPLANAMHSQLEMFSETVQGSDPDSFISLVAQAETALAPLAASSRLMKKDLSWGRLGSHDFSRLHELARHMTVRANGMVFYFKIIGPQRGMPPLSLLTTPWSTPNQSRPSTRPPSPVDQREVDNHRSSNASVKSAGHPRTHRRHGSSKSFLHYSLRRYHSVHHHYHHHQHLSLQDTSLRQVPLSGKSFSIHENPVGTFETQRYLDLEDRFSHPDAEELFSIIMGHLGESTRELFSCCACALEHVTDWFEHLNQDRFWKLYGRKRAKGWEAGIRDGEQVRDKLKLTLDDFWKVKRHIVLDMYRSADDRNAVGSPTEANPPPHLFLFQCYLYQYHLMRFSKHLCQILDELIILEKTRHHARLWLPILPLRQALLWKKWEPVGDNLQHNEDEDPDIIQGIDPEAQDLFEVPIGRDPDALPPKTFLGILANALYHALTALGHGNAVFGLKAGVLSIILSLSTFIQSSARFSYLNRSVWALIYGQLTISRFRGDTAFGWSSRVFSTFLGCVTGMLMWYTSDGLGDGNSFGLAAVTGVSFPILFFIRYNFPASPMTLTIFLMTIGLVVGYSWQDTHDPTFSNAGKGFSVAWKRFLLVTIGVAVAFILSFLPPTASLRRYLRSTYATTIDQIGQLYCDVISFATVPEGPHKEIINKDLIAIRMKLRRADLLKKNIAYELSLRGKWPEERYSTINNIQMEITYLLSHLRSVTEHLEPLWTKAFLRRTRLLEPDFQGDVLGVISMISFALRTGKSLPQVTPSPLLDRYVIHNYGLNVLREVDALDLGISQVLNVETLKDEQYLYFSVGVATVFGILTRLDRLMIATKELVGEQYYISGLPMYNLRSPAAH